MDIKISTPLAQWLKDYSLHNESAPIASQPQNRHHLEQLQHSVDAVHQVTESASYKAKVERLTAEVREQSYDVDIEGLSNQLLAFEGLI